MNLKLIGGIGFVILIALFINWIRKHEFIDIFTSIFIFLSVGALLIFVAYVAKEAQHG